MQKELQETLRLARLRRYQLHLLHRRGGRRQWHYAPEVQELEAQLKAQQVCEQTNGQTICNLGAAFWELRFPKGWLPRPLTPVALAKAGAFCVGGGGQSRAPAES